MVARNIARTLVAAVSLAGALVGGISAEQQSARAAGTSGTVLITGSNRGLGLEFTRQYADRGWKVIATARNPATATDWVTWNWGYHEICWLHQIGQNELVYDGCLQLDMSNTAGTHVAQHPVKMPFGMSAPNDYRFRLVQSGPATLASTTSRRLVK